MIEPCTVEDFGEILDNLDKFWEGDRTRALHHPILVREFGDSAFVIRQGGVVAAYLFGFCSQSEPCGYAHLVAVREGFRRAGLARQLYRHFIDFARKRGCREIKAITSPSSAGSIAFHTSLGMRMSGDPNAEGVPVVRCYAGPGEDRVVFRMAIGPGDNGSTVAGDTEVPVIRPARITDADDLLSLARHLATSFRVEETWLRRSVGQLLDAPDAHLVVAEVGEELVGYALSFDHPTLYANGRVTWVEEIVVRPEHRRRGIGRLLMRDLECRAASRGVRMVELATRRAAPFYAALGYEESAAYLRRPLTPANRQASLEVGGPLAPYLEAGSVIDWDQPAVLARARSLSGTDPVAVARRCFEWVRDEIRHSFDHGLTAVACSASETLQMGAGLCYAKSHLLAALLRANGLPAGLCYQRLSRDGDGSPFCLHGLVAIHLPEVGWYRVDPRGNRRDVDAQFTPPLEQLAFTIRIEGEADLPEIWPDPLTAVVRVLRADCQPEELADLLPDIPVVQSGRVALDGKESS